MEVVIATYAPMKLCLGGILPDKGGVQRGALGIPGLGWRVSHLGFLPLQGFPDKGKLGSAVCFAFLVLGGWFLTRVSYPCRASRTRASWAARCALRSWFWVKGFLPGFLPLQGFPDKGELGSAVRFAFLVLGGGFLTWFLTLAGLPGQWRAGQRGALRVPGGRPGRPGHAAEGRGRERGRGGGCRHGRARRQGG